MEFMVSFSALKELTKPAALRVCVTRKIEHDGHTFAVDRARIWGESATFIRLEYSTKEAMSTIAPGYKTSTSSSWEISIASCR